MPPRGPWAAQRRPFSTPAFSALLKSESNMESDTTLIWLLARTYFFNAWRLEPLRFLGYGWRGGKCRGTVAQMRRPPKQHVNKASDRADSAPNTAQLSQRRVNADAGSRDATQHSADATAADGRRGQSEERAGAIYRGDSLLNRVLETRLSIRSIRHPGDSALPSDGTWYKAWVPRRLWAWRRPQPFSALALLGGPFPEMSGRS